MENTRKKIWLYVQYILQWKFRYSLAKVTIAFFTAAIAVGGGFRWAISGYVHSDKVSATASNTSFSISSVSADLCTLGIIVLLLVGFMAFLYYNDKAEVRKYIQSDNEDASFTKVYLPAFQHIFDELDSANYRYWTPSLAVDGNTMMSESRYHRLSSSSNPQLSLSTSF